jgi:ABC-type glutathione transport system ATPase component
MLDSAESKKVSEMTAAELRSLIKETIYEVIDPDYSLELRSEVEASLRESLRDKAEGKAITLEETKKRLGLQ